jgi:hypothetical protein
LPCNGDLALDFFARTNERDVRKHGTLAGAGHLVDSAQRGVVPVSGVQTAAFLLLAIWTSLLIIVLVRRVGAAVAQAKHELEAEVAEVQQKLQQIQASQPLVMRRIPGRGPQPQDATKETDQVQVVVTMLELEPSPGIGRRTGPSSASRGPGAPARGTRMIVSRQVVTLSPEPGETAGRLIARAKDRLQEELAATAAVPLAEKIGEGILPAAQPWPAAAVDDGSKVLHNIVAGIPVEEITRGLGAPLPMSEALSRVAAVAPIPPADAAFTAGKRVIQIGTIAWGAVTMNPVLVIAGVKAMVHDKVVETVEQGIERTLLDRGPAKAPDGRGGSPHPDRVTHPVPEEYRLPGDRGHPPARSRQRLPPSRSIRRNPGEGRTPGGPAARS